MASLEEIAALKRGWDGYIAEPVSPACLAIVRLIMAALDAAGHPPLEVVPVADGSVQIESHSDGSSVEINVLCKPATTRRSD